MKTINYREKAANEYLAQQHKQADKEGLKVFLISFFIFLTALATLTYLICNVTK